MSGPPAVSWGLGARSRIEGWGRGGMARRVRRPWRARSRIEGWGRGGMARRVRCPLAAGPKCSALPRRGAAEML